MYHEYDYNEYSSSSNIYKNLYQGTNSLLEFVDLHLLSMKINCLNPPCSYSYFYEIENPKNDDSINIPFYFAIGNGLSVSALTQVIFPWNYNVFNILGCIEDIYGSTTCKLIQYTSTATETNIESDEICDYFEDIENHLTLLQTVDDKLSLSHFMTAVIFEIIDGEYTNNQCIQQITYSIFEHVYKYLVTDEYFTYYPFHILQILYLTVENNLIEANTYKYFVKIYEIMLEEYKHENDIFYFPYSDTNYMEWNVSFIFEVLSHSHSVMSSLSDLDEIECSSQSIIENNIYDIIEDISDSITQLLSTSDINQDLQYFSDVAYLYGQIFKISEDEYNTMALTESYTDNSTFIEAINTLQTISITDSNFESDDIVQIILFAFNPIQITQECFSNIDENEYRDSKSDDYINITTATKLVHVSIESITNHPFEQTVLSGTVGNRRRGIDEDMTLALQWKLSNATLAKLNASEEFSIYCQQLDTVSNIWITDNCDSNTNTETLLSSWEESPYFECKCQGTGEQTYGLSIDIQHGSSVIIEEPATDLQYMQTEMWLAFLILYILLIPFYIAPFVPYAKLTPKYYRGCDDCKKFSYPLIIIANIAIQLFTCILALAFTDNGIYEWQFIVTFGLQCMCLGVNNLLLLIIVNDKKCKNFKIFCMPFSPKIISRINGTLTVIILLFTAIAAIFDAKWSLCIVYVGLCGLAILFVVYLSYYWHKGKNFSGGKPFAYTEGTRETIAILIIVGGVILYCLAAANGYLTWCLTNHTHQGSDRMLAFFSLHWLCLFFLAAIIFIVRKFEEAEKRQHQSNMMRKTNADHKGLPNTDDSDNEFADDDRNGTSSDDGIIPPDGTMYNNIDEQQAVKSDNMDGSSRPSMAVKSSNANTMALLASSVDPNSVNPKSSLINRSAGDEFSSTSDYDNNNGNNSGRFVRQPQNGDEEEKALMTTTKQQSIQEKEEDDDDDMNLAIHPWQQAQNVIPGYLASGTNGAGLTSRTGPSRNTTGQLTGDSQLGTDHLGNTMSYEPEMEVDLLDIPQTHDTNHMDEGMETPKSDGQLYTPQRGNKYLSAKYNAGYRRYGHIKTNSGGWKRNSKQYVVHYGYDRDDSSGDQHENKLQCSPYSDPGDSDPGYFNSSHHNSGKHDHITGAGADEYAQQQLPGHRVGVTMSIDNLDEAIPPFNDPNLVDIYAANTHRRSTVDSNIMETLSDGHVPQQSVVISTSPLRANNDDGDENAEIYGMYPGPLNQDSTHNITIPLSSFRVKSPNTIDNEHEPTATSSSMGIFDWNTPPPTNSMNSIMKQQNLDLNGWIDSKSISKQKRIAGKKQPLNRGTSISRRHTVNPTNWRNRNKSLRPQTHLRRVKSSNANEEDDAKLREQTKTRSYEYSGIANTNSFNNSGSGPYSPNEYYRQQHQLNANQYRHQQIPLNSSQTHEQFIAYTSMHGQREGGKGGGMPIQYTSIPMQQFDGNHKTIYLKNYQYNNVNIMYPNMSLNPSDTASMPSNIADRQSVINQKPASKPVSTNKASSQQSVELQNEPKFGTGAGASVRMTGPNDSIPNDNRSSNKQSPTTQQTATTTTNTQQNHLSISGQIQQGQDDDDSDTENDSNEDFPPTPSNLLISSPSPKRFQRQHVLHHYMDENSEEKRYYPIKNKQSMHSRQTTATSFTGTFTQPEYPNIITAENEEQHQQILKNKNLKAVPFTKTTHHLDSEQQEIVNIFEQKTKISSDNDPNNNDNDENSDEN